MKKLTAGIFTVILGLTTVDAFAAIPTQAYVDDAIEYALEQAAAAVYDDTGVKADIEAERVLVKGKVEGNIIAKKIVFVASVGSVKGDISAKHVVLEPGSTFSGKCSMVE